jgi:spermidine synthase
MDSTISSSKDADGKRLGHIYIGLFLLSGISGLMYEVLWVRQFTFLFGASAYAVTIVLTTFMFGLGLGSWLVGRFSDAWTQKALGHAYVFIEAGIAIYSLLLPFLLDRAKSLYIGFYHLLHPSVLSFNALKLVLAFLLLAFPTILIGATLPVMSRFLIRDRRYISASISRLYAANTLGAILGTLLTGYILLPHLGIKMTNFAAAGINFAVAGIFWLSSSAVPLDKQNGCPRVAKKPTIQPVLPTLAQRAVIAGFFLSGAAAMLYEVAWTRTLCMILGTTTYAFSTMLASFLAGIALGSALYRLIPEKASRIRLFIYLEVLIGLSVLMTLPLFEKLPFVYLSLQSHWVHNWRDMQFVRFFLALMVMFIPTTIMGVIFPVVSGAFIQKTAHLGRKLGKVVAANTLGSATGAAVAGLLIIPLIGLQKCIMTGTMLNLTAAMGVLFFSSEKTLRKRLLQLIGVSTIFLFVILSIAPWAPRVINSGPYIYADRYVKMSKRYREAAEDSNALPDISTWRLWEMAMKQYRLLYYRSGISDTVAVMQRHDGVRFLTIDGKTDASTGTKSDMRTQIMIGQLPMLFRPRTEEVLVVGLGSGITAGSVLTHSVRHVDCAEISPAVIEAARFFSSANHNVLDNPRLTILQRDARNLLLTSSKKYDVIISQPSNPWISGESSLFSQDWYRLVCEHLSPQGLFLQWVPAYLMSQRDLKIILNTLRGTFPGLTVWSSGALGDLVLLAKKGGPLTVDYRLFKQELRCKAVWDDIARTGLDPPFLPWRLFVMGPRQLGIYLYANLERPLPRNTDDLLITAFSTPKQIVYHHRVTRFINPEKLTADADTVMHLLKNVNANELVHLLEKRRSRIDSDKGTRPDDQSQEESLVRTKEDYKEAKT